MKRNQWIILLIILSIVGLGCGVPGLVAQAPTPVPLEPTRTPKPTFTPIPSPTNTAPPTDTPIPTNTPTVTNTPPPTNTPVPPTATPAPPTNTSPPPTATEIPPTQPPPPPTQPPPPTNTPPPTEPPLPIMAVGEPQRYGHTSQTRIYGKVVDAAGNAIPELNITIFRDGELIAGGQIITKDPKGMWNSDMYGNEYNWSFDYFKWKDADGIDRTDSKILTPKAGNWEVYVTDRNLKDGIGTRLSDSHFCATGYGPGEQQCYMVFQMR